MVFGSYQRCGLGVEPGSPSSFCTSITLRELLGAADSILVHEVVVAQAVLNDQLRAADRLGRRWGLASNVCGSLFGLLMIALTVTYLPPIWAITFGILVLRPHGHHAPIGAATR